MLISRRQALIGGLGLLAAPAIVKASSLMPVKLPPIEDHYKVVFKYDVVMQYQTEYPHWVPVDVKPVNGLIIGPKSHVEEMMRIHSIEKGLWAVNEAHNKLDKVGGDLYDIQVTKLT